MLAETVGWRWAFVAPLPLIMLAVFLVIPSIYLKGHDPAAEPGILVHECTHVWQYQNRSSRYSTDAIGAQWFADAAYNWENDLASGAARWEDFNGEAEGEFLEDVYAHGNLIGMPATGAGEFYKDDPIGSDVEFIYSPTPLPPPTPDYTTFASDSVAYVREAFAWRLSALI